MGRISRVKDVFAITLLLLGAMLVLVYFNEPQPCYQESAISEEDHKSSRKTSSLLRWHQKMKPGNLSQDLPTICKRNTTVANISGFESFSPIVQDFLYYRHCRSFPMILDLPDKCGGDDEPEDVFLLLVIKSSPKNYERREVLRKTWAEERSYKGKMIRRIFIIGTDGSGFEKERLNQLVMLEHQHYSDVLQWDFKDSFFNLTLKQILFLQWMERRCPQARFLLNGDDDVFANTNNMVEYLQSLKDNDGSKHLFTGQLLRYSPPVREPWSKYFVPFLVYQKDFYPAYCSGGGYLLSGYTASVIYKISTSIQILPIDDVYMGMCLAALKLNPDSHMGVKTLWYVPSKKVDTYHPCFLKELLLMHKFPPSDVYFLWHQINNPNLNCNTKT